MSEEDLIIGVYCFIEDRYKEIVANHTLRASGPSPALTDPEVITMFVVGEYLGLGSDKKIWGYFTRHWKPWFPRLGCRTSFVRQGANCWKIIEVMQEKISDNISKYKDIFIIDGFPIPVCHIRRCRRKGALRQEGAVGYCATKDEYYFGFKGHLLITPEGGICGLSVAAANIDERDMVPEVVEGKWGDLLGDKGLIRPELTQSLKKDGIRLHTPLRKNMQDSRPKSFVKLLSKVRHKIESVIGQLVERFNIQKIRAKDPWHLLFKIRRKIFAHALCFWMNRTIHPDEPLRIETLLS